MKDKIVMNSMSPLKSKGKARTCALSERLIWKEHNCDMAFLSLSFNCCLLSLSSLATTPVFSSKPIWKKGGGRREGREGRGEREGEGEETTQLLQSCQRHGSQDTPLRDTSRCVAHWCCQLFTLLTPLSVWERETYCRPWKPCVTSLKRWVCAYVNLCVFCDFWLPTAHLFGKL